MLSLPPTIFPPFKSYKRQGWRAIVILIVESYGRENYSVKEHLSQKQVLRYISSQTVKEHSWVAYSWRAMGNYSIRCILRMGVTSAAPQGCVCTSTPQGHVLQWNQHHCLSILLAPRGEAVTCHIRETASHPNAVEARGPGVTWFLLLWSPQHQVVPHSR